MVTRDSWFSKGQFNQELNRAYITFKDAHEEFWYSQTEHVPRVLLLLHIFKGINNSVTRLLILILIIPLRNSTQRSTLVLPIHKFVTVPNFTLKFHKKMQMTLRGRVFVWALTCVWKYIWSNIQGCGQVLHIKNCPRTVYLLCTSIRIVISYFVLNSSSPFLSRRIFT